jgi:hypothetical protein
VSTVSTERDRIISVTLSEAEWQAFIARQPQPVQWLQQRVREEVREAAREAAPARTERRGA